MTNDHLRSAIVADPQLLSRAGFAALLRDKFSAEKVQEATSFQQVIASLERSPGVTLIAVDGTLPGLRGNNGLKMLRFNYPAVAIVTIMDKLVRGKVLEALSAGVNGCISKTMTIDEVTTAVGRVLAGGIYVPSAVPDLPDPANLREPGRPPVRRGDGQLTDRQWEVLEQLALGKSNKEIAQILYISENTVKVHLAAAFKHLGVRNRTGATAVLIGQKNRQSQPLIPGLFGDRQEFGRRDWAERRYAGGRFN